MPKRSSTYSSVEVSGVYLDAVIVNGRKEHFYSAVSINAPEAEQFGVYGCYASGDAEHIQDFETLKKALAFAYSLNLPVWVRGQG
jgi:hypothetical protein